MMLTQKISGLINKPTTAVPLLLVLDSILGSNSTLTEYSFYTKYELLISRINHNIRLYYISGFMDQFLYEKLAINLYSLFNGEK